MASLTIYDQTGKSVGKYDIEPTDLAPRINKQLLHDVVVMYQSNLRQGTVPHQEPRRSRRLDQEDVSPEGHRQRPGRFAAQRHSPRRRTHLRQAPRDWTYRLPRKAVQLATRMALAAKLRDDEVTLIDDLKFEAPKTKDMAAILKALKLSGDSLLVTTAEHDINVYKSARNIDRVTVSPVAGLNALVLLQPRRVLMTKAALEAVRAKAGRGAAAGA